MDVFTSPGEEGPKRNTETLMRFSRPEIIPCGCAICQPRKNTAHERKGWDTAGKNERG